MPEIVVKPALTEIGKKRLAEGRFNITKASVSDDGINYGLIDPSFQDPLVQIKRTKLFDVWKDSSNILKNKIPVDPYYSRDVSNKIVLNFQPVQDRSISIAGGSGERSVSVPSINESGNTRRLDFYGTRQLHFDDKIDVQIHAPRIGNPAFTGNSQFLTYTLDSTKHFTIMYGGSSWNPGRDPSQRNNREAFSADDKSHEDIPKTVNIFNSAPHYLILQYKGNFDYERVGENVYSTYLTVFSETTGHFEKIKLSLIPANSQ